MGVILRIDVDSPYGWQSFGKKVFNYLRHYYWFPAIKKLGYLESLDKLVNDLEKRNVPAIFFFTVLTIPKNMEPYGTYEVGPHIVSARNYKQFIDELNQISKKLQRKPRGFTKHGSGKLKLSRRHAPEYTPEKYIEWAQKAKLKYFLGNGENPEEKPYKVNDVLVYPSAFWLNEAYRAKRYDINWLAKESNKRDIIVLFHPYEWATNPQVRKDYERMMDKINNFKTLDA